MTLRDRLDAAMAQLRPSQPAEAAPKEIDPPGVTVKQWMVDWANIIAWVATASLIYLLWLWCLETAGARAEALRLEKAGTWVGDVTFWFPLIIGFVAISFAIPLVGKVGVPMFVAFDWSNPRERAPKIWTGALVALGALVIVTGTADVQHNNALERGREGVIAEQTRDAGIETLQRQKVNAEKELEAMTAAALGSRFQAQAARAGVVGWTATLEAARKAKDPMIVQMERQIGSATAADAIRARIRELDDKIGAAPTQAAVAARVVQEKDAGMTAFFDTMRSYRPFGLSLYSDLLAIIMPWLAYMLQLARERQLAAFRGESYVGRDGRPAWASEAQMIPDFREEERVRSKPMVPNNEEVFDAETGERLVKIKPREYYRRAGGKKKGEPVEVPSEPIVLPDDAGVVLESDSRAARNGVEEGDDKTDDDVVREDASVAPLGADESSDLLVHDDAGGSEGLADAAEASESTDAFYAALLGEQQELTDTEEVYGPPAPEKKLGADGKDGVLVSAAG